MSRLIDLTGQRFGKLVVLERAENRIVGGQSKVQWKCRCDCRKTKTVTGYALKGGATQSCGCLRGKAKTTHGLSKTRIYRLWGEMIFRCSNPNTPRADIYYDKGIAVCEEWKNDFMSFYNWAMSHGYSDELTIDRIDNNKGYSPDNCRWATKIQQENNKTTNVLIEYEGKTQTIAEWAREKKINYPALHYRIRHLKWDIKRALETPLRKVGT